MSGPVGLFERAANVTLQNVKLDGVRIYINGESNDGKDYYPVGALVGVVNLATVDSVILVNDSIQAPFAGGLVGLVKNSTIKHISGDDDIYISNKVSITTGYAGSTELDDASGHQVFLGGLAGAAIRSISEDDPTFIDDSVKVRVQDLAAGHKSALGGIAGLFRTTGNVLENLQVFTKYKAEGEVVPTEISGGASMGGLFGALYVYKKTNGSDTAASARHFVATNCKFDGKIFDAASTDVIAVGGFIGFDSTHTEISVKVENGYSKIDMKDSLKVALTDQKIYQYYAGGILGYGGSCGSGSDNDSLFLTVAGSKTEGSISLSASAVAVSGLHGDAYLGGVVGAACIARAKGLGLVDDTSSVAITSKVKTAVDASKMANGAYARDSIYLGGIVGSMSVAVSNKTDTLSGLYYGGSIVVDDSLNNVFVGGIMGAHLKASGGKFMHIEKSMARNGELISFNAQKSSEVTTTNKQQAKIGGVCGACNNVVGMNLVGVSGGINVTGNYAGDSLFVGGLVGVITTEGGRGVLQNSYSIGNISVDANNEGKKVGFLVGKADWMNGGRGFEVKSSYHYGKGDMSVGAFGALVNSGNNIGEWETCDSVHYVVRNGTKKDIRPKKEHQNGTLLADSMQTAKFAGFLNGAYADEDEYAWSFVKGLNDNLPIFALDGNKAVEPDVDYMVVFVDRNGKTIKSENVKENEDATAPTEEEMQAHEIEGYTFTGEWDVPFSSITSDLTVTALYEINSYVVKFVDYDGVTQLGETQSVEYLASATPPENLAREGYEFVGWNDSSYMQVKSDLTVKATYVAKKYQITFEDYDGTIFVQDSLYYDGSVSEPVGVTRASTAEYVYTFKDWTPEVGMVKGNTTYTATYDSVKVKYAVTFVDYDESLIGDTVWVEYGDAAVAPAAPEREGYTFVEWDRKFDVITKNTEIMAHYEKDPESSSSVESSSSSEEVLVSSRSEGVPLSSSSFVEESSSSEVPVESSSSRGELKIVKPKIEQSGNAIRLTFDAENADLNTVARVKVLSENGVVLDTVISDDVVKGGIWEMTPAPMGKFTVELTLDDHVQKVSYEGEFEVESEIKVRAESWQMVSLSSLDDLSLLHDDDASFYWWDEQKPVGDYWQYKAFAGGDVEATRGFWYGTTKGKPLVLRETTGSKDSEIVWELDSLYSGWNLVANPYGWYVDLEKGAADDGSEVSFWRWNPVLSEYEVPTVIGPYEAVWAKAPHALTWRVSAAPVFGITEKKFEPGEFGGRGEEPLKKSLMKADANGVSGSFALVVTLSDEYGKKDSWNVIGAGEAQSLEEPPAGMGNRVSLAIREVNSDGEKSVKLAKSIKPVSDEYSWSLDVSANTARDGWLSFKGVDELNKLGLKLFVESDGESKEVRDGEALNVALMKSTKQVEVRVADSNVVASSKMKGLRSIVVDKSLQLEFDAPEKLAGENARYVVAGIDGKKVASGRFVSVAGTNRFAVKMPQSGVYFVKVNVGNHQFSSKVLVK